MVELLSQFDRVQIITTRNVKYLRCPGSPPNPHGEWSVVAINGREVLIAKESALVRIPIKDIRKVAEYRIPNWGSPRGKAESG